MPPPVRAERRADPARRAGTGATLRGMPRLDRPRRRRSGRRRWTRTPRWVRRGSRKWVRVGIEVALAQRVWTQAEPPRRLVEPRAAEEARVVRSLERAKLRGDHLDHDEAEFADVGRGDVDRVRRRARRLDPGTERFDALRGRPTFQERHRRGRPQLV